MTLGEVFRNRSQQIDVCRFDAFSRLLGARILRSTIRGSLFLQGCCSNIKNKIFSLSSWCQPITRGRIRDGGLNFKHLNGARLAAPLELDPPSLYQYDCIFSTYFNILQKNISHNQYLVHLKHIFVGETCRISSILGHFPVWNIFFRLLHSFNYIVL